jgi:hypothetical protein
VRAGVAVSAVGFQFAVRAGVARSAAALPLAMGAGAALHTVAFQLAVETPLMSPPHHSQPVVCFPFPPHAMRLFTLARHDVCSPRRRAVVVASRLFVSCVPRKFFQTQILRKRSTADTPCALHVASRRGPCSRPPVFLPASPP